MASTHTSIPQQGLRQLDLHLGFAYQNSIMDIGPCLFVRFKCGIERSLAAGRVGCGKTRVGHFGRTGKLDTGHNPFGCLAHRSYPETLMGISVNLKVKFFSKFESFTPTLIMLMFTVTFKRI